MTSTGRFTPALKKLVHYSHDHCSQCGATLPKGIPAFAGYNAARLEVYVGECCKDTIAELASHIYWWWSDYRRPTPETILWRYMDFSKFIAILNNKALYFPRADQLGDPFEGARGAADREKEWKAYCLQYFREAIQTAPGPSKPSENLAGEAERLYQDFVEFGKREIQNTFVSCWHASDVESEALWRLYCPPETAGIAIRTQFSALDLALDDRFSVKFGYVQYIDFAKNFSGTYDRIFWKRSSLRHEAEVRGVITKGWAKNSNELGLLIPINLPLAVSAVVTSPFASHWFGSLVKSTIQKFDINLPVVPSNLLAEPFF